MRYYIVYALMVFLLSSCTSDPTLGDMSNDDTDTNDSLSEDDAVNSSINTSIYETMARQYLWCDSLPEIDQTNTLLDPESYFDDCLRYRVNNLVNYSYDIYGDRFSYMEYTGSTKALEASSGGEPLSDWGFECIYWTYGTDVQFIQILYVVPNSPADNAGLKRGDLVSMISGIDISLYNIASLLTIPDPVLTLVNERGSTIGTLDLVSTSFDNTPLIYSAVIEDSSPKTGYFFYTEFKNDTKYETALKAMFADFKSQGVENVVIDLRYNPGGYVSTAMLIASALTPSQDDLGNTVMFKFQENASYDVFTEYKYYKDSSIGGLSNHVAPLKIAFIMSSYSASASELVYISLRTIFAEGDIIFVGETTKGKNLASNSYTISDWIYHPITARIYDMNGVSGYEAGLNPDTTVYDVIGTDLTLKEIGDTDERMLSAALSALGVSVPSSSDSDTKIGTRSSIQYTPQYGERKEYSSVIRDI